MDFRRQIWCPETKWDGQQHISALQSEPKRSRMTGTEARPPWFLTSSAKLFLTFLSHVVIRRENNQS